MLCCAVILIFFVTHKLLCWLPFVQVSSVQSIRLHYSSVRLRCANTHFFLRFFHFNFGMISFKVLSELFFFQVFTDVITNLSSSSTRADDSVFGRPERVAAAAFPDTQPYETYHWISQRAFEGVL